MKVTIEIECDNAAFEDNAATEVSRILRKLASDEAMKDYGDHSNNGVRTLRDFNGNTVGSFTLES